MTAAEHNRDERDDTRVDDRFELLFNLASAGDLNSPEFMGLSSVERQQVRELREVLDVVDAGWDPSSGTELQDIETRFLALLGEEEPDHPWVLEAAQADNGQAVLLDEELDEGDKEVATLGQLISVTAGDAPRTLPAEALGRLLLNPTPITDLMDSQQRQTQIGAALAKAEVPPTEIPTTYQWLNQGIRSLTPLQGGAFLARRQNRKRRDGKR